MIGRIRQLCWKPEAKSVKLEGARKSCKAQSGPALALAMGTSPRLRLAPAREAWKMDQLKWALLLEAGSK